jgi:hypothetical protein
LSLQLQLVHIYETEVAGEGAGEEARYVAVAEGVAKAVLSVEAKLRWEELEEFPFAQDSLMSLETLFAGQPLEIAHGTQLSQEVLAALLSETHPLLSLSRSLSLLAHHDVTTTCMFLCAAVYVCR